MRSKQGTPIISAPMTLGNAAAAHVRLTVWCHDCNYQIEPDPAEMAARYAGTMQAAKAMKERRRSRTSSKASINPPTAACGSMASGSLRGHLNTGGPGTDGRRLSGSNSVIEGAQGRWPEDDLIR
jgi:hypothetical protein